MKIIIAGAGNVGTHLAKLLSREKQDIILMDDDEEKLSALSANFDLLTVTASPSSISGLKEVGVKEADLFIAVTPDESRNMTACMLATNLGAKKTVARIDNYEYLLPKNKEFFRKLGVDSLIYPEMLAAKEIVSSMRMSWVRQWWEFCGGALILIGTKMREKAEILNIPLHQLGAPDIPYHVVAIKRGTETIIPRGDDVIKLHDIVYFTTTRKYIPYIRKIAGKEDYADVRNVMIMGGSRIAVRTAQYVPDYMQVKIVDNDINRCNRLTELLDDKTMIINGDGRDMDLLIEEANRLSDMPVLMKIVQHGKKPVSVYMRKHYNSQQPHISEDFVKLNRAFDECGAAVHTVFGSAECILCDARRIFEVTRHVIAPDPECLVTGGEIAPERWQELIR